MVRVSGRNADRAIEVRQRIVRSVGFRFLDAPLHFTNTLQVQVHPRTVRGAEVSLQPRDVLIESVEQAGLFPQRRAPFSAAPTFAEETLEDDSRMRFRRQWRGGGRP